MCGQFVSHYGASSFSKIVQYAVWVVILAGVLVLAGTRQCALAAALVSRKIIGEYPPCVSVRSYECYDKQLEARAW
jgi:hypothetical protein